MGINRPIPDILKEGIVNLKKASEMHNAVSVLIAWYANGCPSKDEMANELSLLKEDCCSTCDVNNNSDSHYGNPYGYHMQDGGCCIWKIST